MTSAKRKQEAFRRLRAWTEAVGEEPTGMLAVGEPPEQTAAALVARLMLGDLPVNASRAPRLASLLSELQRADAETACEPELQTRSRHG